ncbi:hypothetical protein AHiyo6_00470 [Arthrobacter sp. Hiyo6]|nr:hypothetical protein AHiyo6_00470 [Arthrobacter sp. Hiyo6]
MDSSQAAAQRVLAELAEVNAKIKEARQMAKDVAEQNDEWRAAQEEIKALTEKRAVAKKLLEADKDYQVASSNLEELRYKKKDLEEIMSHHLVSYFADTQETQIVDHQGETRQVVVTAKVGKLEGLGRL